MSTALRSFDPLRAMLRSPGVLVALLLALSPAVGGAQQHTPPCRLDWSAPVVVRSVIDGRTLLLLDGREVRLAGIELGDAAPPDRHAVAARAALAGLVEGREIAFAAARTDRYGRLVAHVQCGEERVARVLLAAGHARLMPRAGEKACVAALVAAEKAARTARLGLWADQRYQPGRAEHPGELERGRFAIVRGQVLSVRESGGTIYVNFGRRWTEDFTVTIAKRRESVFAAAGLPPKRLAGRRVLVRGWIEQRGGPWIEAVRPEQIEIDD
jgi:endonuclease YncB( thermonuclease family)